MYTLGSFGNNSIVPSGGNRNSGLTIPTGVNGLGVAAIREAVDAGKAIGNALWDAYSTPRIKRERGTSSASLRGSSTTRVKRDHNANWPGLATKKIDPSKIRPQMSGGRDWRKTFRFKRKSKRSRRRFRRRFIGCRNLRKYMSLWRIQQNPPLTPTPPVGAAYRYTLFTVNPVSAVRNLKVDGQTVPNAENIFPRGQTCFISKLWAQVLIKNPFSLNINYRVIWARVPNDTSLIDLSVVEPWTPVYSSDVWKLSNAQLIRQYTGQLSADAQTTLNLTGRPGFTKILDPTDAPFVWVAYIWTWSELQIQSGADFSTTPTLGYIDVATVIISRVGSNIVCDQGLRVNNNILHGYETGLSVPVDPKVRAADKMGGTKF